jgi:hypothetical protein
MRSPRPTSTLKFSPAALERCEAMARERHAARLAASAPPPPRASALLRPSSRRVSASGVRGAAQDVVQRRRRAAAGARGCPARERGAQPARRKKPTSRQPRALSQPQHARALSLMRGPSVASGSPRSSATRAAVSARYAGSLRLPR